MQDRVETLESQLAEKEQLVAALTERLEQAAEQLDRLHRTGADRGVRAGIAGIPAELVQQQQKLTEELQRAVQQWEDMQPGAFFGRLETQLAQIQELVQQEPHGGGSHSSDSYSHYESGRSSESSYGSGGTTSLQSVLERMQAKQAEPPAEESANPPAEERSEGAPSASAVDIALPPLSEPPEPIDVTAATPEELARACEVRDSYIVYLLQRLRQIESLGHVPNSWAGLENVPGELRARLETLEKRLEETLRLAEVELSLQRAKLAREEMRIRMMDGQMQKQLKQARDASESEGDSSADQANSGRWRRMLGRRGSDS